MTSHPESFLELYLQPLARYLSCPDVTDIYVNGPGDVWVERLGGAMEHHDHPELDDAHLWRLALQMASQSHQGISARHPLLAATLPDGARVQIVAPPATRGGMVLAIRRHVASTIGLDAFGGDPAMGDATDQTPSPHLDRAPVEGGALSGLADAVRARRNIIISGGTSSGKTTLLNALLREIPADERLIVIEDTPELRIPHQNSVGLVAVRGRQGEAEVTAEHLLQAALRMRPDRIIMGELRGPEAFIFLRAINTGHPGSLTTIHADSPERAIVQLAMMALQAGAGISYPELQALVRDMVDVVVQVDRVNGRRRITQVLATSRMAPMPRFGDL
jgi:type IV secretion system protein VirB11